MCRVLVEAGGLLGCGMWTLSCGMHVGSSSLTRDWTQAPPPWEHGVLTTVPPGKSPQLPFSYLTNSRFCFFLNWVYRHWKLSNFCSKSVGTFSQIDAWSLYVSLVGCIKSLVSSAVCYFQISSSSPRALVVSFPPVVLLGWQYQLGSRNSAHNSLGLMAAWIPGTTCGRSCSMTVTWPTASLRCQWV